MLLRAEFGTLKAWGPIALVVAFVAFGAIDARQPFYARYDSGAYVMVARALAAGQGYVDTAHPDTPPFVFYPPLYPAVLALPIASGQASWFGLRLVGVLLSAGMLLGCAWKERADPVRALAVVALAGLGSLYAYSLRVVSEPLLGLVFLGLAISVERWRDGGWHLDRRWWWMTVLASLAPLARFQGLVAPGALVLFALVASGRPDRLRAVCTAAAAGAVSLIPLFAWILSIGALEHLDPDRSILLQRTWNEVQPRGPEGILGFALGAWELLSVCLTDAMVVPDLRLFPFPTPGLALLLTLPAIAGLLAQHRRSFAACLFGVTFALLAAKPTRETRYLVPFVPFLAMWTLDGARALGCALSRWPRAARFAPGAVVGSALALQLTAFALRHGFPDPWRGDNAAMLAIELVRRNVPAGGVALTMDQWGTHVHTGRKAFTYAPAEEKEPEGYRVADWMAKGGRLDAAIVGMWEPIHLVTVQELCARYGYRLEPIERTELFTAWRIVGPHVDGSETTGGNPP